MHSSFSRLDHRPWDLPKGPWVGRQSWCDLLFAHWPVKADVLRPLVPQELTIQEFDSTSWIGVVPFRMEGVMLRFLPDIPGISAFPECNVRIYVEYKGKPGVWFLSLDAANLLAVLVARKFVHLPYHWAKMSIEKKGGTFNYFSERKSDRTKLTVNYKPISQPYEAVKGSLEHWLTERYCLYSYSPRKTLYCVEIHHHPWQLQKAEAEWLTNDLFTPFNLKIPGPPALLHFSPQIQVPTWPPTKVPPTKVPRT